MELNLVLQIVLELQVPKRAGIRRNKKAESFCAWGSHFEYSVQYTSSELLCRLELPTGGFTVVSETQGDSSNAITGVATRPVGRSLGVLFQLASLSQDGEQEEINQQQLQWCKAAKHSPLHII